jgi:hypothetical protein
MPVSIKELQETIKAKHGCDSRHVASENVYQPFDGGIGRQGTVEVFDLIDCPEPKRACAWIYWEGDQQKTEIQFHVAARMNPSWGAFGKDITDDLKDDR